jgi:hypothetical protein
MKKISTNTICSTPTFHQSSLKWVTQWISSPNTNSLDLLNFKDSHHTCTCHRCTCQPNELNNYGMSQMQTFQPHPGQYNANPRFLTPTVHDYHHTDHVADMSVALTEDQSITNEGSLHPEGPSGPSGLGLTHRGAA